MERLFVNVTVENLGPCKRLLRVEIEPEKVESLFAEVTASFQHEARFPGFRPGKAPKDMVAKRFEKEIEENVKEKLLQEGFKTAMQQHKFDIVGQPDVEEVQFARGQAMQFAINAEIAPAFELPEYKGLPVLREDSRIAPEDVERALLTLAEQKPNYQTVTRELKIGDVAVINYKGTCDGKPITETAPTARGLTEKKNFWVPVDATSFIAGFGQQLEGMKAGDKRTITVDFPADFVTPQLAGKKGVYEVELVEAKEKQPLVIDEALAKVYGAASLEKLREGVRADLQNEVNTRQSRSIRNQVAQKLLEKIQISLPESLVDQETQSIIYSIVQENTERGASKDVIAAHTEKIFATAKAAAEQRVKAFFVFQAVAEKEGVRVEQAELLRRISDLAAQHKIPADKLYKDMHKDGRLNDIAHQILSEKVIDLLVQFARIEDAPAAPKA
jgi:trigger factor